LQVQLNCKHNCSIIVSDLSLFPRPENGLRCLNRLRKADSRLNDPSKSMGGRSRDTCRQLKPNEALHILGYGSYPLFMQSTLNEDIDPWPFLLIAASF